MGRDYPCKGQAWNDPPLLAGHSIRSKTDYWQTPAETRKSKKGDCEDAVFLFLHEKAVLWLFGYWPGNGAHGMLVPARIVVSGDVFPDLYHGKHPTHLNVPQRALPHHHRKGISWQGHLHIGHVCHSTFSHGHVVWQEVPDLPFHGMLFHT